MHMRCLRTDEYYRADQWRGTWDLEGGAVLINQAIHFLDTMLWITGGASAACGAYANLTHGDVMETEDTVAASFRLKCGALATIEATSSSHLGWEPTIEIHGTDGAIELRGTTVLKADFADKTTGEAVAKELASANDEQKVAQGKSYYGSQHPDQIADVIDAVRTGCEPEVTARSAGHTVRTVFAIYESHRTGRWVEIAE
jgi:predicted dehydrogenase